MPLTMRGSVSARLSVRFSIVSAERNALRSLLKTSMPPGSIASRAASTAKDVQRRAAFAAGLGEHERPGWKIERGEVIAPGELRGRRAPVQTAGDHQVDHEPQVIVEADRNALADASQFTHDVVLDGGERRLDGP